MTDRDALRQLLHGIRRGLIAIVAALDAYLVTMSEPGRKD